MGRARPLEVSIDSRNDIVRIALSGELDMATVHLLSDDLARAERDGVTAIMLDLRNLTFLDSSGLHAFLEAWNRAHLNGHRLLLVGAPTNARRLFELTDTEFLLDAPESVSLLDQFTGARDRADTRGVDPAVGSGA